MNVKQPHTLLLSYIMTFLRRGGGDRSFAALRIIDLNTNVNVIDKINISTSKQQVENLLILR